MGPSKDGTGLTAVGHQQLGGCSHSLPGSSLLDAEPCLIGCWELLGKTCTGLYLLSCEIFILDTTQIYLCALLNTSTLFLKQSWKHFIPDLFSASPPTRWTHQRGSWDASHRTSQTNVKRLAFSSWKRAFWEYYVATAVNFSHGRWEMCSVWKAGWKRPVALIFYNTGKWGLFAACAEHPSWSIHTDTADILSKYSKLLFSLFLQAMVKADKPLIAQADGY